MLKQYSNLSPIITNLGILLKLWGKKSQFVKRFKMSSYGLILMMLYYLIRAGVLEPLKQIGTKFHIGKLLKSEPLNLLELMINFFKFYSRKG